MMLIKLFLFFLVLLILPDMYIYKAYIRRVSQKWTHWAYWLPSLFLLLGMTLGPMCPFLGNTAYICFVYIHIGQYQ